MTPLVLIPDAERLMVNYLLDQSELTDLLTGNPNAVWTTIAGEDKRGEPPWVIVEQTGGPGMLFEDGPLTAERVRLQISCYGGRKVVARELAYTIVALMGNIVGNYEQGGIRKAVPTTPIYRPDEGLNWAPRYILYVVLTTKATPA